MKRLVAILAVVVAALVAALAWLRLKESRAFSQPCHVRTHAGTNYTFQLASTTVGRVNTNYVIIVAARLENPNPFEVVLRRDWFVLMDHDRDYYQPATNGAHAALICLPARGVLERELLSYTVSGDAFDGVLALLAGHQHLVLVKSRRPSRLTLRDGEFITFHRRDW